VDVRGEALSVVMIDRLPFQPPDDPVLGRAHRSHEY
jgi:Rad3-related DNA helicase